MQNSPEREYGWGPIFVAAIGFTAFVSLTGALAFAIIKAVF
jgi:hypothetical protein